MIAHGLPIFVALEPVDMRFDTMKRLTWDGTGVIVVHKKLHAGRFELPRATCVEA